MDESQTVYTGMKIVRMVDGEAQDLSELKKDVQRRIEMIGKLNDRRMAYVAAGDGESLLRLAQAEEDANDGAHCEEGGGAVDGQKADKQNTESGKQTVDGKASRGIVETRQRLSVALEKLEDIFTSEQVAQMIDVLVMTFDNAVMRKCDQTFTILFNDKGYPVGFNGSNNVKPVRPVSTYRAE